MGAGPLGAGLLYSLGHIGSLNHEEKMMSGTTQQDHAIDKCGGGKK